MAYEGYIQLSKEQIERLIIEDIAAHTGEKVKRIQWFSKTSYSQSLYAESDIVAKVTTKKG